MADRIVVSTDRLENWADRLRDVQNVLDDVAADLRRVDIHAGGAGDQRLRWSLNLRSCNRSLSGRTIADSLDALISGVRSLEDAVGHTRNGARDAARRFEAAENSSLRSFGGADEGQNSSVYNAATGLIQFLSGYTIRYRDTSEVLNRNRAAWEAEDDFINTQYNQDLIRKLREAILNDPAFSEARWRQCTTDAQKEAFIQNMYNRIASIYQTDIAQDIIFVYEDDFVVTKKNIFGVEYEEEQTSTIVTTDAGDQIAVGSLSVGGYSYHHDVIVVNPDMCSDFEDIVGLLCHENRHNLQAEIVDATDLDKYDGVNGEDFDRIIASRDDWRDQSRMQNYFSFGEEDVKKREWQIKLEMDLDQWSAGEHDNAYTYAYSELYERYAQQQIEVDARYAEEYALQCVRQQVQTDAARNHSGGGVSFEHNRIGNPRRVSNGGGGSSRGRGSSRSW